jgi:hypothetical protein
MKRNLIFLTALTILAWGSGFGCANPQNTTRTDSPDSPERIQGTVTGSYIPRDINRSGPVTDGQNNVRIIDRSDIHASGGADTTQTLQQLGVTH